MKPTKELQAAFDHVRSLHPNVIGVLISSNGRWFYYDDWTEAVPFKDTVNVGLLEDAANSVDGPVAFEIGTNGKLISP